MNMKELLIFAYLKFVFMNSCNKTHAKMPRNPNTVRLRDRHSKKSANKNYW